MHWAYDYARRLAERHPPEHRILTQTSMSPSGPFHIGNLRDTVCAYLVHRALVRRNRRSAILLSFDDFDPVRDSQARGTAELAAHAGRPLATARRRSTNICRAFIAELKELGICPATADADGRTPPGSAWETHYQHQRYTDRTYRDLQERYLRGADDLARMLGVSQPQRLFRVYCQQCGRNDTRIVGFTPPRVRYHCRSCTATLTTDDPAAIKPAWALDWTLRVSHEGIDCEPAGQDHCSAGSTMDRTRVIYERFLRSPQPVIVPYGLVRQSGQKHKVSGSGPGGLTARDLLRVMSPTMILWLYARRNCLSDFRIGLDTASYLSYYAEFDRFRASAVTSPRDRALHELLTDTPPVATPRPPGMRYLVGLLNGLCFDTMTAYAKARDASDADPVVIARRVRYALAWLAGPGRAECWLFADHRATTETFTDSDLSGRWDRDRHRRLLFTLFGVTAGPRLERLLEAFCETELLAAAAEYRRSGKRPLRDELLTRLDAGLGQVVPYAVAS